MAKPESVKRMARLKRQKEREGAKDRRTKYNDDRPRELLAYVISWCEMAGQVKTKRLGWRNDYRKHVGLSTSTITKWRRTHPAFARAELEAFLQDLSKGDVYGQVLRAKGMIPSETEGEWYYFDLVPEEYEIRKGQPDYTGKVCVIGAKLDEEALKKVFHK